MKKAFLQISTVAAASILAHESTAAVALDVHGGTLGLGAGVSAKVAGQVSIRGTFNTFTYSYDDEVSDIDYDFDLDLGSIGALLDWHPGGGGFRVSAGAFINDNRVDGTGEPSTPTVLIGDRVFATTEVGTLQADLGFGDVAPYLGIGWGNAFARQGRLGVSVDLGVLFQGEPRVAFRSVGANPLVQAQLDAEVAQEEDEIQDEVDEYDLYPVLSVGISYRL